MPAAIYAVGAWVGSALIAVGVPGGFAIAAGAFLAPALVYGTISAALNTAISALTPRPKTGESKGMEVSLVDSTAEARIIYGSIRCGGINMLPPYTSGNDGEYLHQVLAYASHEIEGYGQHYLDTDPILLTQMTSITGASTDGQVTSGTYDDIAWIRGYVGTMSQNVDYILNTAFPTQWPSTSRGRGFAYVAYQYSWKDGKKWQGLPQPTAYVHGAWLYDPRKDTTNGGSGAHRYATPSTWEYSNNPALAWANYMIATYGFDVDPATEIDWPSVAAAANICEAGVPGYAPFGAFTDVNNGTESDNLFYKTAGGGAWATTHYTTGGITSGHISGMRAAVSAPSFFGLHTSAADAGGTGMAYAFYSSDNAGDYMIQIYEAGSPIGTVASGMSIQEALTAAMRIEYDGVYVRYYLNDKMLRTVTVATAGQLLYASVGLYSSGSTNGIYMHYDRRYTVNGILVNSAEALRDNERKLVDCMLGHRRYNNGKWSIFAGAWVTPDDTIDKEDWLSIDGIQAFAGRDAGRHNEVHVYHVDRARNWQRAECYPRKSATYLADDGGEVIPLEHEQPLCTSENEAQRKAEFLLRQSRNGVKISGVLPPRFQRLQPMQTVAITFAELGWSSKTFRILAMRLNDDGSVRVVCGEEQSTDWTDLATTEYGAPSNAIIPATNPTKPGAPTNLQLISSAGVIQATWDKPIIRPRGMTYQLLRAVDYDSPVSSRSIVWEGDATAASLPAMIGSGYYFWVVAQVDSNFSAYAPTSYGNAVRPEALNGAIPLLRDADFINNSLGQTWEKGDWTTFLAGGGARGNAIRITANASLNTFDPNIYALRQISHVPLDIRTVTMMLEASLRIGSAFNGGGNAGLYVYFGVTDLAGNFAETAGSNLINNIGNAGPLYHNGQFGLGQTFDHYIQASGDLRYPYARIAGVAVNSGIVDITRFQLYLR